MSNDKLKLTFIPRKDMYAERSGKVTLTVPHGDFWPSLLDDCVAFLRTTGYIISDEWVSEYVEHKQQQEKARDFLEEYRASIRDNQSKDAVAITYHDERDADTSERRKKRKSRAKRKKK